MIQSDSRLYFGGKQGIDQRVVEHDPSRVDLFLGARGQEAGPGEGETIVGDTERLHQLYVFLISMIMIASHVPRGISRDFARGVRKNVPNGGSAAIFVDSAFYLIGARRHTPRKSGGEDGGLQSKDLAC